MKSKEDHIREYCARCGTTPEKATPLTLNHAENHARAMTTTQPAITEKRLYAVRKGEPDHAEELITTAEDRIPLARKWAEANGFDRFRVATFTPGEMPNFAKAISA